MTEPIDLVIPMVFPEDKEWQRDYARTHGAGRVTTNVRFRSWQTEELLVRCCMKYMPWLRRIHILLARESQVQPWMEKVKNEKLKVNIVFHREFIPAEYLPCFNVNTIEMFLHRVPGLPEHFIYSNDDFFPLSPLEPSDFFREATGRNNDITEYRDNDNSQLSTLNSQFYLPCQHHDEKPFPVQPNIFQRFVKSGLDMVAADFGKRFPNTWLRGGHSMQPMLRSTVEKVCTLHADRIGKSFTLERTDHSYSQYIYVLYQHYAGLYIDHAPQHHYAGPKTPTADLAAIISDPQAGIVCLNDNEKIADWQRRAEIARREITAKLQKHS